MLKTIDRSIEEMPGRHLGGVGWLSSRVVGRNTSADYIDPVLNVEEVRKDVVQGKARQLPFVPVTGVARVVIVKKGGLEWVARHPEAGDKFGATEENQILVFESNSGAMIREQPSQSSFKNGGRLHFIDIWLKQPFSNQFTAPLADTYQQHELPVKTGPGWTATTLIGPYSAKGTRHGVDLGPVRVIDFTIMGRKGLAYKVPAGYNAMAFVYEGEVEFQNDMEIRREGTVVVFDRRGGDVVEAWAKGGDSGAAAKFILIAAEPLGEGFEVCERAPMVVGCNSEKVTEFCRSEGFLTGIDEVDYTLQHLLDQETSERDRAEFTLTTSIHSSDDRRRSKSTNFTAQDLASPMEPRSITKRLSSSVRSKSSENTTTSPKVIDLKPKTTTMEDFRKHRAKPSPLESTLTYTASSDLGSSSRAGSPYQRKKSLQNTFSSPSASPTKRWSFPSETDDDLEYAARIVGSPLGGSLKVKGSGRVSFSEEVTSKRRSTYASPVEDHSMTYPVGGERRRASYAPVSSPIGSPSSPPIRRSSGSTKELSRKPSGYSSPPRSVQSSSPKCPERRRASYAPPSTTSLEGGSKQSGTTTSPTSPSLTPSGSRRTSSPIEMNRRRASYSSPTHLPPSYDDVVRPMAPSVPPPKPIRLKLKGSSYELKERLDSLLKLRLDGTPNLDSAISETQTQLNKAREKEAAMDGRDLADMEADMQRYELEWRGYHHVWATHLSKMYAAVKENPAPDMKAEYKRQSAEFQQQLAEYQKRRKIYECVVGPVKDPMSSASSSASSLGHVDVTARR